MAILWRIMLRVWLASASTRRPHMLIDLFPHIVCNALIGVDESVDEVEVEPHVLQISKK